MSNFEYIKEIIAKEDKTLLADFLFKNFCASTSETVSEDTKNETLNRLTGWLEMRVAK